MLEDKSWFRHKLVTSFQFEGFTVNFFFSRYREVEPTDPLVSWLWSTLESFSNEERVLFMRFVSGRSRLPTAASDISQRFQIVKVDRVSKQIIIKNK